MNKQKTLRVAGTVGHGVGYVIGLILKIIGALLLILADALAKLIAPPIILPIGAIMSFIGGPVFLILLFRGRNSNG